MNKQEILINCLPYETRVAVIEQGLVQDIFIERSLERGQVGNIYLGKVTRVLPGMQAAFIDIGLDKAAFLHVADWIAPGGHKPASQDKITSEEKPALPIEKQLYEGQVVVVQVMKDPLGSKGARLTAQISIAGRFLVLMPQDEHIGVSQKIASPLKESLRDRLLQLLKTPQLKGHEGGLILRTNGEDATDEELIKDIEYLQLTWKVIKEGSKTQAPRSLLYQELDLAHRVLRDMVMPYTHSIRVDSLKEKEKLSDFSQRYMPDVSSKIMLHSGDRFLFDLYRVDEEINKALSRKVVLKSGGYLMIDQTEALTVIDVNTGTFVGLKNFEETIFKTNLEAAQAIARQLRLRNLGGIVVIDFIDMHIEAHQKAVLQTLSQSLARDRVKTFVGAFSPLGLLELTRKRTRESLVSLLSQACPTCEGKRVLKSIRSICYEILREILIEAKAFEASSFCIIAHPKVIEAFLDEESIYLAELSEQIQKPISLKSNAEMIVDAYDIVLR